MLGQFDTDVEEVLNSGIALEYFKEWIRLDPVRQQEATDLYFALKGFKNYLRSADAGMRAQMIHRKYVSLKSGSCNFLPKEARQEMSNRIHALKPSVSISSTLFDPVWLPLLEMLKSWHARFVCSEPFNRLKECESQESTEDYQEVLPLGPPETMRRPRKQRYSCDPSTSRPFGEVEEKKADSSFQHERPEERNRFARELTVELQKIADEINRQGGNFSAREVPKSLAGGFSVKEKVHEKTLSDEELDKYADRLDRRRSDSESPPTVNFIPNFAPMVPSVPGYDFNVTIPERFTYNGRKTRTSGFNDTSGFCSSESAYFSSERSYRSNPFTNQSFSHSPFSHTLQRKPRPSQQNCFATLPRRSSQPKVQCRLWRDGEVAPYTAELPGGQITLYQFRKTFAVRRDENLRLLFKSPCEDDSAPFQWSLISDDSEILPLFQGRIVGEARRYVDSD